MRRALRRLLLHKFQDCRKRSFLRRNVHDGFDPFLKKGRNEHGTVAVERRVVVMRVGIDHASQHITEPAGMDGSAGVMSEIAPFSSSAQRSMPSERRPAIFRGFRFTSTMTFRPTISSGL